MNPINPLFGFAGPAWAEILYAIAIFLVCSMILWFKYPAPPQVVAAQVVNWGVVENNIKIVEGLLYGLGLGIFLFYSTPFHDGLFWWSWAWAPVVLWLGN